LFESKNFCSNAQAAVIGGIFLVNVRRLEKPKVVV
jgi:hypothetical protein